MCFVTNFSVNIYFTFSYVYSVRINNLLFSLKLNWWQWCHAQPADFIKTLILTALPLQQEKRMSERQFNTETTPERL